MPELLLSGARCLAYSSHRIGTRNDFSRGAAADVAGEIFGSLRDLLLKRHATNFYQPGGIESERRPHRCFLQASLEVFSILLAQPYASKTRAAGHFDDR